MKLFTKAQHERLVKNGKTIADHVPVVKLFTPWGRATWLITEIVAQERLAFGLCDLGLGSPELGYVDLFEIQNLRGPFGLKVERDRHFKAEGKPISQWASEARKAQKIVA